MIKKIPDPVCFNASAAFRSQLGQVIQFWGPFWGFFFVIFCVLFSVAFWVVFGSFWDAFGSPFWVPLGLPGCSEVALESDFVEKGCFLKKQAPLQGE